MQSLLQGVHAQGDVHPRTVGEEGRQGSLNKQAENQDSVPVGQEKRRHHRRERKDMSQSVYLSVSAALSVLPPCLLHALLKEGVPPGLADDEIGPLDNHDADKEAGVAGVFHDLPLLVGLPCWNT